MKVKVIVSKRQILELKRPSYKVWLGIRIEARVVWIKGFIAKDLRTQDVLVSIHAQLLGFVFVGEGDGPASVRAGARS